MFPVVPFDREYEEGGAFLLCGLLAHATVFASGTVATVEVVQATTPITILTTATSADAARWVRYHQSSSSPPPRAPEECTSRCSWSGEVTMDWLTDPQIWIALATLTFLEIVLGIDNIIFISILSQKLPAPQQPKARRLGLVAAMVMRLALLFSLAWIIKLTGPLFSILGEEISGRDMILFLGGLFLLGKATYEIHDKLEGAGGHAAAAVAASFGAVILQIMLLDIVFSLDSVITAVGMVNELWVMITAVVISIGIMLLSAETISAFVNKHPTVKMLALSFLLLIGLSLIAESFDHHIPKGYIYFAMGFSVFVEMVNMRLRKVSEPVQLKDRYAEPVVGPLAGTH